jgi:DNA-binding XRE family transcriptional regulator
MPTKNRIRVLLAENHETAKSIVPMLPDVDRSSMSYIVQGRVLPTKQTLNAMTAVLHCTTKDLYDLNDIDLAGRMTIELNAELSDTLNPNDLTPAERKRLGFTNHGHDGMERVYIWYPQGGKEALFDVIKQLDYPSVAEWFRDMARITFLKAAKLDGQTLHEAARGENHEQG